MDRGDVEYFADHEEQDDDDKDVHPIRGSERRISRMLFQVPHFHNDEYEMDS